MRNAMLARAAAAVTVLAFLLGGCGFRSVYSLPLPGGADTGENPITFTVEFTDVLDLVPKSAVKVGDVSVGRVSRIELDGWHAKVYCTIQRKVHLPDNAYATIRQTSLLGEKYVQLKEPPDGQQRIGRLADGDNIPLSRTERSFEVEEVLSALAALLNGGGLPQLQTINRELNAALSGREDKVRDVIDQLDTFLGALDKQKGHIDKAINSLDKLAGRLKKQQRTINETLAKMPPALKVLANQRHQLVTLLQSLSKLGEVGKRVIRESKDDLIANLKALRPILTRLAEAGANLPKAIGMLLTYPFPPNAADAIKGDYTNIHLTADINLAQILEVVGRGGPLNGGTPTPKDIDKLLKSNVQPPPTSEVAGLLPKGLIPTDQPGQAKQQAKATPSPSPGPDQGGSEDGTSKDLVGLLLGGLL